jgi:CheY-like chemotaxis protein
MILAALDDLLFRSRIGAAASGVGAPVQFARTAEEVVGMAAQSMPSLLLLDLNCRAFDPIALLGRLKGAPILAGIRVVGFVSHVQSDLIAAARGAGIDEVLARSAFVSRLPELLRSPS